MKVKVGDLIRAHDRLDRGAYFPLYPDWSAAVLCASESGGLWTGEAGIVLENERDILRILVSNGLIGWIHAVNVEVVG